VGELESERGESGGDRHLLKGAPRWGRGGPVAATRRIDLGGSLAPTDGHGGGGGVRRAPV
jgi:hypothetical protein